MLSVKIYLDKVHTVIHILNQEGQRHKDHRDRRQKRQGSAFSVKVNHCTIHQIRHSGKKHDYKSTLCENLSNSQGSICSFTLYKLYLRFYLATTYSLTSYVCQTLALIKTFSSRKEM